MRRLLWVGDAGCSSGFAKATHHTLDVLRDTWEVSVLGINWWGDPQQEQWPYPIYSCFPGGDFFGLGRLPEVLNKERPDVVVLQNDPWNIPHYMKILDEWGGPVVGAIAVDGRNMKRRASGKSMLDGLSLAIFWTNFGLNEARLGGYDGPAAVVPLGVDLDIYKPFDRCEARRLMEFKLGKGKDAPNLQDAFIVGNVNRNQPRKRLDLTVQYFAEWVREYDISDAYLFLHVAPTGEEALDVDQLMHYYGVRDRLIISRPDKGQGVPEHVLRVTYATMDVGLTTTLGEGWGLPTMEMMACGVPVIVPNWAALGEWTTLAAMRIPCYETSVNQYNVVGGIVSKEEMIESLMSLYESPGERQEYSSRGLELVARPEYRWPNIGKAFGAAIDHELYGKRSLAEQQQVDDLVAIERSGG